MQFGLCCKSATVDRKKFANFRYFIARPGGNIWRVQPIVISFESSAERISWQTVLQQECQSMLPLHSLSTSFILFTYFTITVRDLCNIAFNSLFCDLYFPSYIQDRGGENKGLDLILINLEFPRPKTLLVYVNPFGGRKKAWQIYHSKVCLGDLERQFFYTYYDCTTVGREKNAMIDHLSVF